ncbi:MAG: hypothetical protein PWP08_1658 [Methanofollis sp.]|nr:hypothetical protein [Methanofollis sp.]
MEIHRFFSVLCTICVLVSLLPTAAAAEPTSTGRNVEINCDFPGQVVEAGQTATFTLSVTNHGNSDQMQMWWDTFSGSKGWEMRFSEGDTEVNRIAIPTGGTKTVSFAVETAADTKVGEYPVKVHVGDAGFWLYVTISKSHAGEVGTLQLAVTDKDGEKVKGATVLMYQGTEVLPVDQAMTTADGKISTDLPQGTYRLDISKPGYKSAEKKDVKVKCGLTTDAGTVMLEKSTYAAELTVKSAMITAPVGTNPVFEITLKNVGKSDDVYSLSTLGLPEGWYARYLEDPKATSDISEMLVRSGEEKTLYLDVIPPYGTPVGDYSFQTLVESSLDDYTENLTINVRGAYDLRLYADQYRYEANMGDTLSFDLRLRNAGTAGALTNIGFEVSAPQGWKTTVSPSNISSLQAGETETVTVDVVPPSSIVASEYKITVKATADQGEKSDDFRIVVKEQSFAAIIGFLLLVAIAGGVWYYFRKYHRR